MDSRGNYAQLGVGRVARWVKPSYIALKQQIRVYKRDTHNVRWENEKKKSKKKLNKNKDRSHIHTNTWYGYTHTVVMRKKERIERQEGGGGGEGGEVKKVEKGEEREWLCQGLKRMWRKRPTSPGTQIIWQKKTTEEQLNNATLPQNYTFIF